MIGSGAWCDLAGLPRATFDALYADGPTSSPVARSARPGRPSRSTAGTGSAAGGRSPAAASTAAGCTATASRTSAASAAPHGGLLPGRDRDRGHVDDVRAVRDREPPFRRRRRGPRRAHVPTLESDRAWTSRCCGSRRRPSPRWRSPARRSASPGALADIRPRRRQDALLAAGPLATNPLFQHQLATADTQLRAARALLYADADAAWATAIARCVHPRTASPDPLDGRMVTSTAAAVVDICYRAGGGSAIYLTARCSGGSATSTP